MSKLPDQTPTAAQWAQLNAHLAQWLSPQERQEAIGLTPQGRTNDEISQQLAQWLRDR